MVCGKLVLSVVGVLLASRPSAFRSLVAKHRDETNQHDLEVQNPSLVDQDLVQSYNNSDHQAVHKSPFKFHFSWEGPPKTASQQASEDWGDARFPHSVLPSMAPFVPQDASKSDAKDGPMHAPHGQGQVDSSLPFHDPPDGVTSRYIGSLYEPKGAFKSSLRSDPDIKVSPHNAMKQQSNSPSSSVTTSPPPPHLDASGNSPGNMPGNTGGIKDALKSKVAEPPASAPLDGPEGSDDFPYSIFPSRVFIPKGIPTSQLRSNKINIRHLFTIRPILGVTYSPYYTPRSTNDSHAHDNNRYEEWFNNHYKTAR